MGRDVKTLLKDDVLNELSIGYDLIDYYYDEKGIRHLKEVDLLEVSVVTWAMNPEAKITGYKSMPPSEAVKTIVGGMVSESKEGRKISGARVQMLTETRDAMREAVKALDKLITEADPPSRRVFLIPGEAGGQR